MNTKTIRLRESGVRWSEHDGDVVVRDEQRSMSFTLNHSAALLWMRLADGADVPDLIEALCDEYDVDTNTAAQDVDRFVIALEDYELLETE